MRIIMDIKIVEKINAKRTKGYEILTTEYTSSGNIIQTYANHGKSIAVISARFFLDTKYVFKEEGICIFSSEGNDQIREEYIRTHDTKEYTMARSILSGF